jgi:hypothetical protein
MAFISAGSASFFSEDTYRAYLEKRSYTLNERLRGEDETFFDAMLSEEADLTKSPEGREIFEFIRSYE